MDNLDYRLAALAARQLGLVTRHQVLAVGGTSEAIAVRLERQRWQQLQQGVYLVGVGQPSWLQLQLAACLAIGPEAVASHRAAAALWELDGAHRSIREVTVALARCPTPVATVLHRTMRFDPVDRTSHLGLPTTTVTRTLIDYGAVAPKILVERAAEDAFRRGLSSEPAVHRRLLEVGGRGCRGVGVIREVLGTRLPGKPARSGFEVLIGDICRRFGVRLPQRRVPVAEASGRIIAELDLAYPDRRVGLEADGERWHHARRARERNYRRHNALTALGWTILYFTWDQVVHDPGYVATSIRSVL